MKIRAPKKIWKFLVWNSHFVPKWYGAFTQVQKFIDSEILRYNVPYLPFQAGSLEKSGLTGTKIGSGEINYNSPYGRYLYYGKVMVGKAPKKLTDKDLQYHGAPMRGALWFERMKTDHKKDIKRGASKILRGTK